MTRLYYPDDLFTSHNVVLNQGQIHYLRHVLRVEIGHPVILFNERDGEWSGVITELSKSNLHVTIGDQIRPAVNPPELSLLFAPIKHDPLTFLIEKATELGVKHFYPVTTERCNISRVNKERLKSNVIEAAQQCERFDIPTIYPLMRLSEVLASWNVQVPLFVCQERGSPLSITQSIQNLPFRAAVGFLIGPEGGFSPAEFSYLQSFSFVQFISLGPRILRAETAALVAIACYQAIVGDWGKD